MQTFTNRDVLKESQKYTEERLEPFLSSLSKEGDRSASIVSVCVLDDLLEKLLRAWFVKEPQVKELFSNDHILQSYYSKVSIAYFSGLIPKSFYHDFRLIGEIRNYFAHSLLCQYVFAICL